MNSNRKNMESYRNMSSYFGSRNCQNVPGMESLPNKLKEGFDGYTCNVVVPTEVSMSYGKVFDRNPNSQRYNGYLSVNDGYAVGQKECGQYRNRSC